MPMEQSIAEVRELTGEICVLDLKQCGGADDTGDAYTSGHQRMISVAALEQDPHKPPIKKMNVNAILER